MRSGESIACTSANWSSISLYVSVSRTARKGPGRGANRRKRSESETVNASLQSLCGQQKTDNHAGACFVWRLSYPLASRLVEQKRPPRIEPEFERRPGFNLSSVPQLDSQRALGCRSGVSER